MNDVESLQKMLEGKLLQVPDYQRGYAWGKQQWTDLIEDLEYLAGGKVHLTGTVILHAQSNRVIDAEGKQHDLYHVVDGQQRLTTITILLHCISCAFDASDPLSVGIRKNYIAGSDRCQQPIYKLTLNRDCQRFFVEDVLSGRPSLAGPTMRSQQLLAEARDFFEKYLASKKSALGEQFPHWLEQLYLKVTQSLKFLQYSVGDQSEVGVIFEVTNDRGKPLSELEKVKNYLLYLANKIIGQNTLASEVNETWTEIFERLMSAGLNSVEDENRLLRAHWLMAQNYDPKTWDGAKSIKSRFNLRDYQGQHSPLLADLLEFARSLRQSLVAFCDAYNPSHSSAFQSFAAGHRDEASCWGEKLIRIGNIASYVPLLIATRFRYPNDPEPYLQLLKLCERASFRVFRWANRRSNAGQTKLFRLAYELYHNEKTFAVVELEFRAIALQYCSNTDFINGTKFDGGSWYEWYGLRYFLYEYERYLAGRQAPRVDWTFFASKDLSETVEHILPQTPTDSYWTQRFSPELVQKYLHDIGNLCLTYDNSSYSNKPFPAKRGSASSSSPCYATSKLFMEQALARFDDWTEAGVLKRRQHIMDWALERWHIDDSGIAAVPSVDDEQEEENSNS